MRKIEREMVEAFTNGTPKKKGNDQIIVADDGQVEYRLHGNRIAHRTADKLTTWDAGFRSNTTKSRLNAILANYSLPRIVQKSYVWYWTDGGHVESWARTFDI